MIFRYFDVVLMLCFVMISVNAQGTSTSMISASPAIPVNSSGLATTPISSPAVINTSIVSSTRAANTSSTSPSPASTSHVTPSSSPTPVPTKAAPTKKPNPHGTPTKGRSFDAASFFGGIILGIVVAIACFVGYTWWQNKRKSYHSL